MKALRKARVGGAYAACALLVLAVSAEKLPKARSFANTAAPWNSQAIQSTFAGVRIRELNPAKSEVVLLYDLDNKTDQDYQLAKGPGVLIMSSPEIDGQLEFGKAGRACRSGVCSRKKPYTHRTLDYPGF